MKVLSFANKTAATCSYFYQEEERKKFLLHDLPTRMQQEDTLCTTTTIPSKRKVINNVYICDTRKKVLFDGSTGFCMFSQAQTSKPGNLLLKCGVLWCITRPRHKTQRHQRIKRKALLPLCVRIPFRFQWKLGHQLFHRHNLITSCIVWPTVVT